MVQSRRESTHVDSLLNLEKERACPDNLIFFASRTLALLFFQTFVTYLVSKCLFDRGLSAALRKLKCIACVFQQDNYITVPLEARAC